MNFVDAEGLECPLPLLRAKQALNKLQPGDRLKVTATDAASERDFKVFAEHFGHDLVLSYNSGVYTYLLTKSGK